SSPVSGIAVACATSESSLVRAELPQQHAVGLAAADEARLLEHAHRGLVGRVAAGDDALDARLPEAPGDERGGCFGRIASIAVRGLRPVAELDRAVGARLAEEAGVQHDRALLARDRAPRPEAERRRAGAP